MSGLSTLTKPQWDAALEAARALMSGNVHNADDRAAYRAAKAKLVALLPAGVSASQIVEKAAHWDAMNFLAGAFAGLPIQRAEHATQGRGGSNVAADIR